MNIEPCNTPGNHRTGSLVNITKADIEHILGFAPNVLDDPSKVQHSWGFTVDGVRCGIWDWKGSWRRREWSTWGPSEVLSQLFGSQHISS